VTVCRRNEIKLIFMDCRMPILDGYEATRILRQEKKVTTPIVAVTANNRNEQNEKLCFDSGMNDYVEKPIRSAPSSSPSSLLPLSSFFFFFISHFILWCCPDSRTFR